MTVSSIEPVNNYTGNMSVTTFDFDFLIEDESELIVQHIDSNGIITRLQNGVDYTIHEIGNINGSYITFPIAGSSYGVLNSDEKISLMLSLVIKQEKELRNSLFFNFNTLEWMFDYIVRILQILNRKIERAVKVEEGIGMSPDEFVASIQEAKVSAEQSAIDAANYAEDINRKTKVRRFTKSDWVKSGDYYILELIDLAMVSAVYRLTNGSKQLAVNVDITINSDDSAQLRSLEAFDGYCVILSDEINTTDDITITENDLDNMVVIDWEEI